MYCHAMATLALCEAYALTGDDRLRDAGARAVAFLVRARARDGMAWRYAPGAPVGDTSILGWVVMGLKSAKEVGIPIPGEAVGPPRARCSGSSKVATGQSEGLARYQPGEPVTPDDDRRGLGLPPVPGRRRARARQHRGGRVPARATTPTAATTNFYYWYYATLALYQHGGEPWSRWNAKIRDRIVGLQHRARDTGREAGTPTTASTGPREAGSTARRWPPLTLEVYYRYLRLYDEPKIPLEAGETPDLGPR